MLKIRDDCCIPHLLRAIKAVYSRLLWFHSMFRIALSCRCPIRCCRIGYHGPNVCSHQNRIDVPNHGVWKTIVTIDRPAMIHRAIMSRVAVMASLLHCNYLIDYHRLRHYLLHRHAIYRTINAVWLCSVWTANDYSSCSPMSNY